MTSLRNLVMLERVVFLRVVVTMLFLFYAPFLGLSTLPSVEVGDVSWVARMFPQLPS